jgi:hypothetical protein
MKNILDELLEISVPVTGNTIQQKTTNGQPTAIAIRKEPDPIVVKDSYPVSPQDDDMAFARRKMRNVIKVAEDAMTELAVIASDTQQPRAYEVLANLLKTTAEATKELIGTHKTRAEINRLNNTTGLTNYDKQESDNINTGNQVNIEKAVFVGTAADLMDHLDAKKRIIEANNG